MRARAATDPIVGGPIIPWPASSPWRIAVCNVRPDGERANLWVLNGDADPRVTVERRGQREPRVARRATDAEAAAWWPRFVALWPGRATHLPRTNDRSMFVLESASRGVRPGRREPDGQPGPAASGPIVTETM